MYEGAGKNTVTLFEGLRGIELFRGFDLILGSLCSGRVVSKLQSHYFCCLLLLC